jgi:hypothetical protein
MARTASRNVSAWNKAVKSAFAKISKRGKTPTQRFTAAIKAAKKSYKPASGKVSKRSVSKRSSSTKRCSKGSHRRMRGKGSRCVKN